jgi:hypothetical protein
VVFETSMLVGLESLLLERMQAPRIRAPDEQDQSDEQGARRKDDVGDVGRLRWASSLSAQEPKGIHVGMRVGIGLCGPPSTSSGRLELKEPWFDGVRNWNSES